MDHLFHLWSSGVLLFCTTVGWEEVVGRSFFLGGWLSGEDITSILFTQKVYSTHPLRTHVFRETLPAWNMLFCAFCLCCLAGDSTDLNCSQGQERDKTIKVEYCLDHKSPCFCFHLSSSHFIWTCSKWKGSLHPFPRKKHKSTPIQKYK